MGLWNTPYGCGEAVLSTMPITAESGVTAAGDEGGTGVCSVAGAAGLSTRLSTDLNPLKSKGARCFSGQVDRENPLCAKYVRLRV